MTTEKREKEKPEISLGDIMKVTAGDFPAWGNWRDFIGYVDMMRISHVPVEWGELVTATEQIWLCQLTEIRKEVTGSISEDGRSGEMSLKVERGETLPFELPFHLVKHATLEEILAYEPCLVGKGACKLLGHEWIDISVCGDRTKGRAVCGRCGERRLPH